MLDVKNQFDKAAVDVLQLIQKPADDTLLKLYSLYKQATVGDVFGVAPAAGDIKARARYEAWAKLKGMQQKKAMEAYIQLVDTLQG